MQISRHWRMNSQRYRLEGIRYQNGQVELQPRSGMPDEDRGLPPVDFLIFNVLTREWQPYQPEGNQVRGERELIR